MSKYSKARVIAAAALLTTAAACSDQPTGLEIPIEGPSFSTSTVRTAPTDVSGITNTHYGDHSELLTATTNAGAFSSSSFTGLSDFGGHLQTGVRAVAEMGLPSHGSDYLIVSSGDTRDIVNSNAYYPGTCVGGRCDVGGSEVSIALGYGAQKLVLDARYFSRDDQYWPDPFRIYLTAGGTTTLVKEFTTTEEFAGTFKAAGAFGWSPTLHHLQIDVAAFAGQTVVLRFEASDTDDGFGGALDSGAAIDNIRVLNADAEAPVTSGLTATPNPVAINTPVTLSAWIDDVATGNSSIGAAEFSLDGGTTWQPMAAKDGLFNSAREEVTVSLGQFATPTVISILVRGEDGTGNLSAAQPLELAVYDPNGSYIAGAGAIDSPAGAYAADPAMTGTAQFGFSSKYMKGTTIPTGNARFTFRTADFKFESVAHEWLVVAGAKGQFKGTGTINGLGNYGFKIFGIDGDAALTAGPDRFRIKIWDIDNGDAVVYDNEMNVEEGADPTTVISHGQIRISK